MAAGLGFKTFTTGEVLTAADTNGYLMQGILVFASAAARDSAITSPQEGQACYLKDTNEVLTYSGSAWVAVGGSAAGNLAQIATGTLSGASVTISSLSTYDNLILAVYNTTNSTADGITKIRINNNSGSNYQTYGHYWDGSSPQNYAASNDAIFASVANNDRTVNANSAVFKLTNAKQAGFTDFNVFSRNYSGSNRSATFEGVYTQSEAVSSLVILNSGGNWSAGTYILWGS